MPSSQVQRPPLKNTSSEIPVVAIGASAGGLEALTAILRALPTDIAMAFMLIQHLDPKRHSILPELLSKATRIPVLEAINAMKIESNRVYVMPSNVNISITDGHFGLTPRVADHKQHLPNDELNSNNSALHLLGNDLKNLLERTVIPIVMVDKGLFIR